MVDQYQLKDQDLLHTDLPKNGFKSKYVLRVRDLDDNQKPREKLLESGVDSLGLDELIAVILGTGTRKEEVLAMSKKVAGEYGQKALSAEKDPKKLAAVLDIPIGKASQIIASIEVGRRMFAVRRGLPIQVRTDDQAFAHLKGMGNLEKEHLRGLYLNSRYQIVHDEIISIGTLTANLIHPREVFSPALEKGAVAIIIAHNHPSGELSPTAEDLEVTSQLKAAGELLGIELLDHLVIARNGYRSIIN